MGCGDCPYTKVQVDKMASGCHELTEGQNETESWISARYLCKKIGGAPCLDGRCSDARPDKPEMKNRSKRDRLSKRERDRKYKKHLQKLVSIAEERQAHGKNAMYGRASYIDEGSHGFRIKPFYRRHWRGVHNNRFKYWLKVSNRKVRRYKGDVYRGGFYKKIFDYWWTVD